MNKIILFKDFFYDFSTEFSKFIIEKWEYQANSIFTIYLRKENLMENLAILIFYEFQRISS